MIALRSRAARAWRAVAGLADGPYAAAAVVAAALLVYALVSIAWPLGPGRDVGTYVRVWVQLFDPEAVYPQSMLARTPLSPIVIGVLLEAGAVVAEIAMAVLYALSVLAWCVVARRFGTAATVATALALLLFPGYVMLFHRLSTDSLFAAGFAFTAVLLARALERPTTGRAAALGGAVAALVFVRPSSQVLLALGLVPLLARGVARERLVRAAAFGAAALVPLAAWAIHNGVRFDDYTVVRGGGATVPFFRAFVVDRIVSPENGPASRELARAVDDDLLVREPYRSYGVTLDEFFTAGSGRMHEDLVGLADRTWGWDDDYGHLSAVAREAVRKHPGRYARGVLSDLGVLLRAPLLLPVPSSEPAAPPEPDEAPTIVVNGRRLPEPSEGDLIPSAHQPGLASTPDVRIRDVWTSPTEHHLVYRDPDDARHARELERNAADLLRDFPARGGSEGAARALNWLSRVYPRSILILVVGAVAVALRRPRGWPIPAVLTAAALLICVVTMLGVYAVPEYVVPVAPAFVLLASAGLLGRKEAGVILASTLVVRDEADVVDAQIAYHLAAGVDVVVATDHQSEDGTTEILEEYERRGVLRLLRESGPVHEDVWRTQMARLAARELGADWVINTDADEFWLPRRGTLKETLAAVPEAIGAVHAVSRHFVPRPDGEAPFDERMLLRFAAAAALNDPMSPYRPHGKVAHRGDPAIVVHHGAHRIDGQPLLTGWQAFDVLHFPYRSLAQYERKTMRRARGDSDSPLGQYVRGLHARERGRVAEVYAELVVDDEIAARGLAAGSLAEDARLRDALRSLRAAGGIRSPTGAFRLGEPADAALQPAGTAWAEGAVDAVAYRDAEVVRLLRFATDLAARVGIVERRHGRRRA